MSNTSRSFRLVLMMAAVLCGTGVASQVFVVLYGTPPYPPLFDLTELPLARLGLRLVALAGIGLMLYTAYMSLRMPSLDPEDAPQSMTPPGLVMLATMAVGCAYASFRPIYGIEPTLHMVFRAGSPYLLTSLGTWGAASLASYLILSWVVGSLMRLTPSHSKGSNRWGKGLALRANKEGIILGEKDGQFLRYNGQGHLLTVAATRSGKGVSGIIPNLLEYPGSVVVADPKGENFWITARYRIMHLNQKCVALDPFNQVDEKIEELRASLPPEKKDYVLRGAFNPFDLMREDDPFLVELTKMFADMIVPKGNLKEPFWDIEASALLQAFILHLATSRKPGDEQRSMMGLRRIITLDKDEFDAELEQMKRSTHPGVIEGANRVSQKADKERASVLSTAHSHTHFIGTPAMNSVLKESNFDIRGLLDASLSIYLVLPAEQIQAFARWLRLMYACAYWVCTHGATKRGALKHRVLFLMEEFANLGRLDFMNSIISLGAGYGVTAWMILQDLSQLKREYDKEWESFIANVDVIQAFGISDSFTAEQISKLIGETTVWSKSLSASRDNKVHRYSVSYGEQNRPLLRPDELRRLHPDELVLLVRPLYPILARKVKYYDHPFFKGRWDKNPLFYKKEADPSKTTPLPATGETAPASGDGAAQEVPDDPFAKLFT